MFKKIALAVALVAATSFATWDYYKVPEAGKGQGACYDPDLGQQPPFVPERSLLSV